MSPPSLSHVCTLLNAFVVHYYMYIVLNMQLWVVKTSVDTYMFVIVKKCASS